MRDLLIIAIVVGLAGSVLTILYRLAGREPRVERVTRMSDGEIWADLRAAEGGERR